MKPPLVIITGPSAAGKDEVMNHLVKSGRTDRVVTHTTRLKRANEIHGVDYNFVTKNEFEELISKNYFIEYVIYDGTYRGTAKTALEPKDLPLIWRIDASRAGQIVETFETVYGQPQAEDVLKNTCLIYLSVSNLQLLKKRSKHRDQSIPDQVIEDRFNHDLQIWEQHKDFFNSHLVLNEDNQLEKTLNQVEEIIKNPQKRIII